MLITVALPVPLYKTFDYLPKQTTSPNNNQATIQNSEQAATIPMVGCRVKVPFGRQTLVGMVVAHTPMANSNIPRQRLKPIKQQLDITPIVDTVDNQLLTLAHWLADYYHHPLGDVLSVMLPTLLMKGKAIDDNSRRMHWRVCKDTQGSDVGSIASNAHQQKRQYALLQTYGQNGIAEDQLSQVGLQKSILKKLIQKGLVESFEQNTQNNSADANSIPSLATPELTLNEQQQQVVDSLHQAHHTRGARGAGENGEGGSYHGFLLYGITGSGKTEVYLQAIYPVLQAGKQVLILVPEIGLTPQTKTRFAKRFNANVLLLHSGLTNHQRLQGWIDCKQGQAQIIIGTRSAVLYEFANLGMIIVDEAHDASYKQQDSLRYQAADVAMYRGYQAGFPVVLGTATPTLEQLKLVQDGKLTQLSLTQRAGNAQLPRLHLVDARISTNAYSMHTDGSNQHTGLTQSIINSIRKRLEANQQVLIFLNRRGYAPILLCRACGWQADCPRCDAHLTVHYDAVRSQSINSQPINPATNQNPNSSAQGQIAQSYTSAILKCHHCGYQSAMPAHCPDCHSPNIDAKGIGTSRLTANLHTLFANPQTSKTNYPIIQIDRDTTSTKGSWEKLYQQINQGHPAILVGTQMLAKGHHFPNVTLVVLPNADRGFLSADFRSPEHTAQLITQVSGRAGRSNPKKTLKHTSQQIQHGTDEHNLANQSLSKPVSKSISNNVPNQSLLTMAGTQGQVLIQTLQPHNPLLLSLVRDGYYSLAHQLLHQRRLLGLPPYRYAALIRAESTSEQKTIDVLNAARQLFQADGLLQQQNNRTPAERMVIIGPVDAPMHKKNSRFNSQLLMLAPKRAELHGLLNTYWLQIKALPEAKSVKLVLDVDPISW